MRRRRSFTQPKARRKTGGLEKEERQSTNAGTPDPRAKHRQRGIATTKAGLPGGKERRQSRYRKKKKREMDDGEEGGAEGGRQEGQRNGQVS